MKKLLFLLIVPITVIACQKDPDFDELSDDYLVVTTYDPDYNFSTPTNIYVPASIVLFEDSQTPGTWTDSDAQQILSKFTTELEDAGYTVVDDETIADLLLDVTYVENTSYFVDYPYYWWWWDPYWWDGGYWPGWYWPYPLVYSYSTGSLIAELVDPAEIDPSSETLPSVWYVYIAGDESGSEDYDTGRIVTGINKAFTQSKYIKK